MTFNNKYYWAFYVYHGKRETFHHGKATLVKKNERTEKYLPYDYHDMDISSVLFTHLRCPVNCLSWFVNCKLVKYFCTCVYNTVSFCTILLCRAPCTSSSSYIRTIHSNNPKCIPSDVYIGRYCFARSILNT